MTQRLKDKVAFISGAARGQGAAEAMLFAREGAKVVVADMRDDEGSQLVQQINSSDGIAIFIHLDVTKEADWKQAIATTAREFGRLDILINNAGILHMEGVEDTSLELWNRVIEVNQTGVFLGMKQAIPEMRRCGGGSIINVSSIAGIVGTGTAAAYQATKGAIRVLTKTAALEYAKDNIRINSIHPGIIDTQMMTGFFENISDEGIARLAPLGRAGTSEDIAKGVLFLASDDSAYMTGSELVVDGGYTAQ